MHDTSKIICISMHNLHTVSCSYEQVSSFSFIERKHNSVPQNRLLKCGVGKYDSLAIRISYSYSQCVKT